MRGAVRPPPRRLLGTSALDPSKPSLHFVTLRRHRPPMQSVFDAIAELSARGVRVGSIFGKRALLGPDGKAFVCLHDDALAFKLGRNSTEHASALALDDAALFDPSGKGKPFKDWVKVPEQHAAAWRVLAAEALAASGR